MWCIEARGQNGHVDQVLYLTILERLNDGITFGCWRITNDDGGFTFWQQAVDFLRVANRGCKHHYAFAFFGVLNDLLNDLWRRTFGFVDHHVHFRFFVPTRIGRL